MINRHILSIILTLLVLVPQFLISQVVLFRCDDYGLDEPHFYLNLKKAIDDAGAKLTIGVVPMQLSGLSNSAAQDSILGVLTKSPNIEIAQHGLSHRSWTYGTEFTGRSYQKQEEDIATGKKILEEKTGIRVKTFIPPFNTYDANTVNALQKFRFQTISGGVNNTASAPENSKLCFIPSTISLHRFTKLAIQGKLNKEGKYIVLFHTYGFTENQGFYAARDNSLYDITKSEEYMSTNLASFSALLELLRDKKAQVMTISELADSYGPRAYSSSIIKFNKSNSLFPLPEILHSEHPGYLLEKSSWFRVNQNTLIGVILYLSVLILSYFIATKIYMIQYIRKNIVALLITLSAIVLAISFISMKDGSLGYKVLLILSTYGGLILGILRGRYLKV